MYSTYVHHSCLVFPVINVLCQSDQFVITDESTMARHYYPKSIAYFRIHSWCRKFQQVFGQVYSDMWASLVAHTKAKNQPAMQETWIQSLGQEDPLEKRMATHSSVLAWRIPWTEEPGGLVHGVKKRQTRLSNQHFHFQKDLLAYIIEKSQGRS